MQKALPVKVRGRLSPPEEMLTKNIDYFKSKPVNVPKITILLDHGYHPDHLTTELKKIVRIQVKNSSLRAEKSGNVVR